MAIAFISGAVIGCLIGAALVYAYELKTLSMFGKKVDEMEHQFNRLCAVTPRVAYICDRKFCEECDNPDCHHVFDIRHARNFECIADNEYWEKEPDYKKFADEVLEMLNMYCDDGNEIYIKKRVLEVNMKSILEEFV